MTDLHAKLKVSAEVSGTPQVDGLAQSVDRLGDASAAVGGGTSDAVAGFRNLGAAAEDAGQKTASSHRKISDGVRSISEQLSFLTSAIAAWSSAQATVSIAADIGRTTDAYKGLLARMQLVTGEGEALRRSFDGVIETALATGSALEGTGQLFTKLAQAGADAGLSSATAIAQAQDLVRTINQAIQVSGASAQASEAAITQLVQGLQGGVLRGDEFNSVMEQAPRLARAMADGLGVTTGELRKMAEAGQLTSEVVIGALRGQAVAVEKEFAALPATIGRAFENLATRWTVYVGEQDAALGASATAAAAIDALAENLETVGDALANLGQGWLAFKAYGIAREFLAIQAATAAAGAAVRKGATDWAQFGIAAQLAGAQAQASTAGVANAAAGASVGVGRLGAALSLLKGFSLAFLVTNLVDIGKWLGETAAKASSTVKAMEAHERSLKAAEKAAKMAADADAELAQKMKLAEERALGLSAASKKLVDDFEKTVSAGGRTSKALEELSKALDLSGVNGIAEAGAALDALAAKGRLTADEVRVAWQRALDGKDLQKFEVEARAAFDGSAQGVRRLEAALDAQLREAIRRTGLDMGALAGEINTAAVSALNDFDTLIARLADLEKMGVDTGVALKASLDQALSAATTAPAVQAVVDRWKSLGEQGLLTGDQLTEGLRRAGAKLDEIRPGIDSVAEAYKALGMKTQDELARAAATAKSAYDTIRQSGTASARDLQTAFKAYAEAAIAANGGVASEMLRAEAAARGVAVEVDAAGKAVVRIGDESRKAADATGEIGKQAANASAAVDGLAQAQQKAADATNIVKREVSAWGVANADVARDLGLAGDAVDAFAQKFSEVLGPSLQDAMGKWRGSVVGFDDYIRTFQAGWSQAEEKARQYAESLDYVNGLTSRLQNASGEGAEALAAVAAEAERAAGGVAGLGEQDLAGLRSALASAKSQMEGLKDSAESALSSLEIELAQMNGNYAEAERLRIASRRADLEAQLAIAQAQGNGAAASALSRAITTLDQIAARKIAEARQRESEELARAAQTSSAASRAATQIAAAAASLPRQSAGIGISQGGGAGGNGARLEAGIGEAGGREIGGGEGGSRETVTNHHYTTIKIEGVLDVNDRATLETLGRKLSPVLGEIQRRGG